MGIRIAMVAMAVAWRPGRSWAGKMVVTSQLHDNKVNDPVTVVGRGHTRAQGWQGTKEMAVRVEPACSSDSIQKLQLGGSNLNGPLTRASCVQRPPPSPGPETQPNQPNPVSQRECLGPK